MRSSRNCTHIFSGLILFGLISLFIVIGIPSSTALQSSLAALPQAQPTCTPPPSGMVSWWPGDGNAFDIQDSNQGTFLANTYGPGKVGQAFSFNGSSEVTVADNSSLNVQSFTIDAWVFPTTLNGGNEMIADKETGSAFQYHMSIRGPGRPGGSIPLGNLAFFIGGVSGLPNDQEGWVDGGGAVPLNTWTHVALTFDGSSAKTYINGEVKRDINGLSGSVPVTDGPFRIGSRDPGLLGADPGAPFNGSIDEVEVFNRALSETEIDAIHDADSAGKCRTCTPPPLPMVSWWPGDGNAFDIQDSNDGTPQNGATFAPGKVGDAFSFDGTNQFVEVPDAPNLNFAATSPITVDLWAFRTGTANPAHLLGKRIGCNIDFLSTINYQMAFDGNGLEFGAGPGNRVTTGIDLPLNTWTHLAGTFDGATFRLYMNGVLIGMGNGVLGSAGAAPLKIGGSGDCATFPGLLDEVEIFDRALSQSEIQLIVGAGNAGKCKPPADLAITKTHSGNFTQGDVGKTYTITVTNNGATATSDIVNVADTVPAGLTATAISGTGWSCDQPSGPCTRGDALAPRASYPPITLTVDVANNAPTSVTNTATVSGGGEVNTGNDTTNDPTTINAGPDLTITKTHVGNFSQGQTGAQYTITVTNSGSTATSSTVSVSDTVPSGLTATAISGTGWTCTQPSGPCTRSNALNPSASYPVITLTVNVASNAPASVTNSATVSGGSDTNTGNNTANDLTTINPVAGPDLTITKTHSGNFSQGQTGAQYTITVTNSGGTATSGTVSVSDTVPSGLTATAISGTGWTCTQPSGPCTRNHVLAASASYPVITLTLNVASNAPASVTNTATVSGGNDSNTGNNTAHDLTTINPVAGPDLTITKTHSGNFSQGQTGAQYTIAVTNSGGTTTSGTVSVSDTVPSGLTATAISGTGWSCTQPSGPCTRSNALNPSNSYPVLTLTVNVASNAPASVTNTATVSGGGETNTGNDTANDPTTINPSSQSMADLDIEKSDASDPVLLGSNVSYKIEVENDGPGNATNVTITDTVPASLTNISAPGCSISGQTVTCTITNLANQQEVTRIITAKTNATGTITNTVTVTANEPDPNSANNTDTENTKVVVGVASVSLNPSAVNGGKDVTGTVTLSAAATSNTVVSLSSSNTSVAKPAVSSVTITTGQTSKTFTVKTFKVSSTKTAKIKASANGTSKEATLTVKP